ncbi:MAG: hypothetical protein N4A68_05395 [Maledivibacter sp.]|nr:hypothetical protein [Maledivibacter sp.]
MRFVELLIAHWMEGVLFIAAGLGIINIRLRFKNLALLGIMFALTILGVRELYEIYNIPYGTHSFVLLMIYAIILKTVGKQRWDASIIAVLISFLLLILGEGVFMFNIFKFLNISIEDMLYRPGFRFFGTALSCIPVIIVFIATHIFKFSIIDLNRLSENEDN